MSKTVIVYGPQGCGKTRNAERLRRGFGLNRVIDEGLEFIPNRRIPASGALVLTNAPETLRIPKGVRLVPFAEAMRKAGVRTSQEAARV